MSKYYFFWNGYFSQWDSSPFIIDGVTFNCCEQWMMFSKASVFKDKETAMQILREKSPRIQKALGRRVANFDADHWNKVARDLVYIGNMAKFQQNIGYLNELLSSGDKIIVEASPYDNIWGIGFDEEHALDNIENWGTNWLGEVLMKVREDLKNEN